MAPDEPGGCHAGAGPDRAAGGGGADGQRAPEEEAAEAAGGGAADGQREAAGCAEAAPRRSERSDAVAGGGGADAQRAAAGCAEGAPPGCNCGAVAAGDGSAAAGSLSRQLEEVLRRLSAQELLAAERAAEQRLLLQNLDCRVGRLLREDGPAEAEGEASTTTTRTAGPRHGLRGVCREPPVHLEANLPHAPSPGEGAPPAPALSPRSPSGGGVEIPCRTDSGLLRKGGRIMQEDRGFVGRIVQCPAFDGACAFVIGANAIALGAEANDMMVHALEHVGLESEWEPPQWLYVLHLFFVAFYIVELTLRLLVYRRGFFTNADKYWNMFDSILVATAVYEEVTTLASVDTGIKNMTWLRLLRLLKMLKMLRVFRLLKFFSELRTMLSSIVGSVLALLWACMLLMVIEYVFALVFLQELAIYLREMPLDSIESNTVEDIGKHWHSIFEATLSLYKASTGGNDWADLSRPIRQASVSSFYLLYLLFLFYIAFFLVCIMNVVTGMFVDAAGRVRDKDNRDMVDLILEDARSDDKFGRFKEFIFDKMAERGASDRKGFSWDVISQHSHATPIKEWFSCLQMDLEEGHAIFNVLQMEVGDTSEGPSSEGVVSLDEFIQVCEAKLKDDNILMASVDYEVKMLSQKVDTLMGTREGRSSRRARLSARGRVVAAGGNGFIRSSRTSREADGMTPWAEPAVCAPQDPPGMLLT